MGWLAFLVLYFIMMAGAIQQIRARRRRGLRFDWSKGLVTTGGCLLITCVGCGSLIGFMAIDQAAIGAVFCFVVIIGGMIGLTIAINRRWPAGGGART
jgi:hypothetical protein